MKKTKNKNRDAQKKRTSIKAVESVLRPEGSSLVRLEATPDVNTVGYSILRHMDTVAAFVDFMRRTVAHWFDPATRTDL